MLKRNLGRSVVVALACGFVLGAVQEASAQNKLANAGFEAFADDGSGPKPTEWDCFNHTYSVVDADNGTAHGGERKLKMFGPWAGPWNASGCGQNFSVYEDDVWTLGSWVMNSGIDPIQNENFAVLKFEYFDAGGARVSGWDGEGLPYVSPEMRVADVATPLDAWNYHELQITVPANVASITALVLHVQPDGGSGGSVNFDDATLVRKSWVIPTVSEWGLVVMTLVGLAGGTMLFRRLSVV